MLNGLHRIDSSGYYIKYNTSCIIDGIDLPSQMHLECPLKYAYSLIVFCFVGVILYFLCDQWALFTHILQGYFSGTSIREIIIFLPVK